MNNPTSEPRNQLREFVEHLAYNGIPADASPTLGGRLKDGTEPHLWYAYLDDLNRLLKSQARQVLADTDE